MTAVEEAPASTAEARRSPVRAIVGWVVVGVLVVVVAWVGLQVAASAPGSYRSLDPESARGTGTLALAETLRDRGVEVEVVRSRVEAAAALDDDATLVLANPYTLTDEAVADLLAPASRVVLLSVGAHLLDELDLGSYAPGAAASVEASCDVPEFARVGSIRPDQLLQPADGVTGCFGDDGSYAVLVADRGDTVISAVDASRLFTNEALADDGNAALALALLGQEERVVWYVPSLEDSDIEAQTPDTLGDLTPDWVTPAILLLLLAGAAAALWRGRRFGPLVAETLPVTVRASETMQGRARLTARAGDAAHASVAVRDGTRLRLARRLTLGDHATVDEIADAAADRLRIPRGTLQGLLGGPAPTDDAALIELARRLADLEAAVEETLRPRRAASGAPTPDPSTTTEDEASRDR